MNSTRDPESMTADERRLEVACILASGLLRRIRPAKAVRLPPREMNSNQPRNRLDDLAETRLSVAPRPAG